MLRRFAVLGVSGIAFAANVASAQETTSYSYDALGRLTGVQVSGGPNSGVASTYSLDPAGNRSSVVVTGGGQTGGGTGCTISVSDASNLPASHYAGPLWFGISRTGSCSAPTVIQYATRNGTALAGVDYAATSGTLTMTTAEATITVDILSGAQPNEQMYMDYSVVSGGTPSQLTAGGWFESP